MPTHDKDLLTWALRWAKANGETDPSNIRYVQCASSVVEKVLGLGSHDPGSTWDEVDLVMMDGDFVGHMASPPKGAKLPAGPHLHILFDHRTHHTIGWGMGSRPYDTANSGLPVIILKP